MDTTTANTQEFPEDPIPSDRGELSPNIYIATRTFLEDLATPYSIGSFLLDYKNTGQIITPALKNTTADNVIRVCALMLNFLASPLLKSPNSFKQ